MSSDNISTTETSMNNSHPGDSAKRVSQFSYIKAISCFAIVLIHCINSARVYHADNLSAEDTLFAHAACSALMWAVPCFLMVTGALLLNRERVIPLSKLFGKYIRRMLTALIIFTAVFTLMKNYGASAEELAHAFIDGLLYNHCMAYLWYIYLMIVLYLLMPFYKAVVNRASDGALWVITALLLVVCSLLPIASYLGVDAALKIPTQIVYGVYPLLGFLLYRHKMNAKVAAVLALICTVALPLITYLLAPLGIDASGFSGYNSPIVVLQSAALYSLMLSIRRPAGEMVSDFDRCSFGIYLIHMIFVRLIMRNWGFDPFALGAASIFVLAVIIFYASFIMTDLLKKLRIFSFL